MDILSVSVSVTFAGQAISDDSDAGVFARDRTDDLRRHMLPARHARQHPEAGCSKNQPGSTSPGPSRSPDKTEDSNLDMMASSRMKVSAANFAPQLT